MNPTAHSESSDRITPRRVSFDSLLDDMPRYFAADIFHSHLATVLSAMFPDGEDFFVRSVSHFRSQVTDPELKQQVAGFIGQEAIHGREHRALNQRLIDLGYPIERIGARAIAVLLKRERHNSAMWNLAATAALEHFTAAFAESLMADDNAEHLLTHPGARQIFLWHALEECEHKAVAFDLYRAVGGTEKMRIQVMKVTAVLFLSAVMISTLASLLTDRNLYRSRNLRAAWRGLRRSPVINRDTLRSIGVYNTPGFHPNQIDTDHLVAEYRQHLFGPEGSLTPALAGATG